MVAAGVRQPGGRRREHRLTWGGVRFGVINDFYIGIILIYFP